MESPDALNTHTTTSQLDEGLDVKILLGAILDKRLTLAICTALAALSATFYATVASPVYQAGAMLQVEEKVSSLPGLDDLSEAFGADPSTQAELEILKSRSVVGAAVDNLQLTTRATPTYFPVIGNFLARRFNPSNDQPFAPPFWGLDSYAWGGESLTVSRFDVRDGKPYALTLVAGSGGAFTITDKELEKSWTGKVNKTLVTENFSLFIAELNARPGTHFEVASESWLKVTQGIRTSLSIAEAARQSGIIRISFRSTEPLQAEAIVNEISRVYVEQNVRRLSAEAENSLKFLRDQIPFVQKDLQRAETAFNTFASSNQSIDVTAENQSMLSQLVDLDTRIQELDLERVELNRRFTSNHPNVLAAEQQYKQLQSQRLRFNQMIEALPETQQQLVSLRRDVEVASGIYELLLYKAQEMEVARAGTLGNVRIIDRAMVDLTKPVAPRKPLIILLGMFLGAFFGVALVLTKRGIYRGIESAEEIESTGLAVFASVPFSSEQQRWDASFNSGKQAHKVNKELRILAKEEPSDLAIEMLRNLRTSLYFNLAEASNNAVMVTGPSPGVGKSFVSVNLAATCAFAGQKVLLIDGDMRRGYLHRYVNKANKLGLADYLSGQITVEEAISETHISNLHVMTRGKTPPNPSELLMHPRLLDLVQGQQEHYDLILWDTPPVLAVTDATILGQTVGNSLLVCRFDKTSTREINHAVTRLNRDGIKVTGAILNGIEKRLSSYYGYGGYYGYGYGYSYKSKSD